MFGGERRKMEEKHNFLFRAANETFLDVKKIPARWLWEMLTKKRLPERFEIFCCLFTAYFCVPFVRVQFHPCWKIYIASEREKRRKEEFIFIIHHFAVETRARPRKKSAALWDFFASLAIAMLKVIFVSFCSLSEERYIVTAASDIYFCKHPHNVVALL